MPSFAIIGASRGLGYQYLKELSSDPSNTVIGIARNKTAVDKKLQEDKIDRVQLFQADLTSWKDLNNAAANAAKSTGGSLDYLIVNGAYVSNATAALTPTAFTGKEDLAREDFAKSFETNVLGTLYAINAFLPLIRVGSTKKIIVISTGMADPDFAQVAGVSVALPYTASKAAVNMLVTKFAIELKEEGILVLALSPGLVNTADAEPTEEEMQMYASMTEMFKGYAPDFKGPITPEESVNAQLKVIKEVGINETGNFISHHGNRKWL